MYYICGYTTNHMLCLKMSSVLVRIREPSGATGLGLVFLNFTADVTKVVAGLATEKLRHLSICSVEKKIEKEKLK